MYAHHKSVCDKAGPHAKRREAKLRSVKEHKGCKGAKTELEQQKGDRAYRKKGIHQMVRFGGNTGLDPINRYQRIKGVQTEQDHYRASKIDAAFMHKVKNHPITTRPPFLPGARVIHLNSFVEGTIKLIARNFKSKFRLRVTRFRDRGARNRYIIIAELAEKPLIRHFSAVARPLPTAGVSGSASKAVN